MSNFLSMIFAIGSFLGIGKALGHPRPRSALPAVSLTKALPK